MQIVANDIIRIKNYGSSSCASSRFKVNESERYFDLGKGECDRCKGNEAVVSRTNDKIFEISTLGSSSLLSVNIKPTGVNRYVSVSVGDNWFFRIVRKIQR